MIMAEKSKYNLVDVLIISFAIGLAVIGMDQMLQHGFLASYWIFMFVIGLLGLYQLRKKNRNT